MGTSAMFWVDASYCRMMAQLGYLPQPSHWFWDSPQGPSMHGYRIPLNEREPLINNLNHLGAQFSWRLTPFSPL